ncbi:hypothetical protein E3J38_04225 [candidate division TA06 bacterium]|uniref:Uncharacterized protein n=1 Tax=candidate division TA06 bacterium TaxID=2250710 RepID=A0A523XPN6_UNCT6|nr:MAG: hypothetical protein E3J38_04225 [candidate division TA06 bacterium]
MRKKEEILNPLAPLSTPTEREIVEIEVLIDIRDVLREILTTLETSAGQRAFQIGQASLQEISR